MLGHPDRDLRQLLDLMTRRLPTATRSASREHVAAATPRRPVIDELVDRPRRQQLTAVPLMTGLPARRTPRAVLAARRRGGAPGGSWLGGNDELRELRPSRRSSPSTRASKLRDPRDPSPTTPRQPPHDPPRRSPPPQPAPHPRIRRRRVMSPNQLNAYGFLFVAGSVSLDRVETADAFGLMRRIRTFRALRVGPRLYVGVVVLTAPQDLGFRPMAWHDNPARAPEIPSRSPY